jgi:hypothetical protein
MTTSHLPTRTEATPDTLCTSNSGNVQYGIYLTLDCKVQRVYYWVIFSYRVDLQIHNTENASDLFEILSRSFPETGDNLWLSYVHLPS